MNAVNHHVAEEEMADDHIAAWREKQRDVRALDGRGFFAFHNEETNRRDVELAFVRGAWDFSYYFAGPLCRYLNSPEDKVALEIGCGGGRLLASAARHFRKVIGVDVHGEREAVEEELRSRGVCNVELHSGDGRALPISDGSVDFAYSFIVFQHVERLEILRSLLSETFRVLTPGGLALLFFGRYYRFSHDRSSRFLYWRDRLWELLRWRKGYVEYLGLPVGCINLQLSLPFAKRITREAGFRHLESYVSRKGVPDGTRRYGMQHGLLLEKPA